MTLAIVTGGARGIGRAIAEKLTTTGHRVLLVDISEAVEQTAGELDALAVRADITDPAGIERVVDAIEASGETPLVLVNNAGITRDALVRKMTEDEFRLVLKVNLGATLAMTERIAPLLADGGSIVNLSSRGQLGNVGQFNYAVSKGGVIGLARAHALAFAPRLRVNAVGPGFIESDMTHAMPEAAQQKILATIPMARPGTPKEIADVIAWLVSPDASYVTGEVIYIAGGRSFS